MTPDEIHSLGLENVDRIHAEMRPLFAELGYPADGSIPDLFGRLTQDSGVHSGQNAVFFLRLASASARSSETSSVARNR